MKNFKIKMLSLGIASTVILSSTPIFAATNTTSPASKNSTSSQGTTNLSTGSVMLPQSKVSIESYYNSSNYYGCYNYYVNVRYNDIIARTLSYGDTDADTGGAVSVIQDHLNTIGYNCGTVDGIFGSRTKAAVQALQRATYNSYRGYSLQAISDDGIVGPYTWGKLEILFFGYQPFYN